MNIKIASANKVKVTAIVKAFERYFNDVEVVSEEVTSGVPNQPINQDVFKGAENRIEEIKKKWEGVDYFVSCEGGILNLYGNWFNVQVIIIEDKHGKRGLGISQGFQIPTEYVEEAINISISQLFDKIFDGKGGIRMLSQGAFTREGLITDATIMALTRVINGDVW